jgi:hypothetical protein
MIAIRRNSCSGRSQRQAFLCGRHEWDLRLKFNKSILAIAVSTDHGIYHHGDFDRRSRRVAISKGGGVCMRSARLGMSIYAC